MQILFSAREKEESAKESFTGVLPASKSQQPLNGKALKRKEIEITKKETWPVTGSPLSLACHSPLLLHNTMQFQ